MPVRGYRYQSAVWIAVILFVSPNRRTLLSRVREMVFCDRRYRSLEVQLCRNSHHSYLCFSVHVEDLKVGTRIIKLAKCFAINFNPTVTVQTVVSEPYPDEKDRII